MAKFKSTLRFVSVVFVVLVSVSKEFVMAEKEEDDDKKCSLYCNKDCKPFLGQEWLDCNYAQSNCECKSEFPLTYVIVGVVLLILAALSISLLVCYLIGCFTFKSKPSSTTTPVTKPAQAAETANVAQNPMYFFNEQRIYTVQYQNYPVRTPSPSLRT